MMLFCSIVVLLRHWHCLRPLRPPVQKKQHQWSTTTTMIKTTYNNNHNGQQQHPCLQNTRVSFTCTSLIDTVRFDPRPIDGGLKEGRRPAPTVLALFQVSLFRCSMSFASCSAISIFSLSFARHWANLSCSLLLSWSFRINWYSGSCSLNLFNSSNFLNTKKKEQCDIEESRKTSV